MSSIEFFDILFNYYFKITFSYDLKFIFTLFHLFCLKVIFYMNLFIDNFIVMNHLNN